MCSLPRCCVNAICYLSHCRFTTPLLLLLLQLLSKQEAQDDCQYSWEIFHKSMLIVSNLPFPVTPVAFSFVKVKMCACMCCLRMLFLRAMESDPPSPSHARAPARDRSPARSLSPAHAASAAASHRDQMLAAMRAVTQTSLGGFSTLRQNQLLRLRFTENVRKLQMYKLARMLLLPSCLRASLLQRLHVPSCPTSEHITARSCQRVDAV